MEPNEARFEREILAYFLAHPEAMDTSDGILQYWIGNAQPNMQDEREIVRALDGLTARGWVARRETTAKAVFSLNRHAVEEIRSFLERSERST